VGVPEDRLISEDERDRLSEELGDGFRVQAKRNKEIEGMNQGAIGIEIKKTKEALREWVGVARSRSWGSGLRSLSLTMAILCLVGGQVNAFTAYDCLNRSYIIESCLLLEPDTCGASDKAGEVKTTVYREIMQIKQD
jgi:hypothetical protein